MLAIYLQAKSPLLQPTLEPSARPGPILIELPPGFPQIKPFYRSPRQKKYACEYCNTAFYRPAELKRHIRVHTGERPFTCPDCSATFAQSSHLYGHQRRCLKKAATPGEQPGDGGLSEKFPPERDTKGKVYK